MSDETGSGSETTGTAADELPFVAKLVTLEELQFQRAFALPGVRGPVRDVVARNGGTR